MKRVLSIVNSIVLGSIWSICEALCVEHISQVVLQQAESISGILTMAGLPCPSNEDSDPCPPCLTLAFVSNDTLYYLTSDNESMFKELNELEALWFQDTMVFIIGIPYKENNNNYMNVKEIKFGNEPMFTPDTEWHYRHSEMFGGASDQYTYTLRMKDTLLNGIPYQVIGNMLLRSEGAKVWCVVDSMGESVEKLLYDFDLQVGDSIRTIYAEINPEEPPCFAKVTNVDTIILSDGRQARRIRYDGREDDIEHVGNITGIFDAIVFEQPTNGIVETFVCCTRGDCLLYEIGAGECDALMSTEDISYLNSESEQSAAVKIFRDGQILVLRNGKYYSVSGFAYPF